MTFDMQSPAIPVNPLVRFPDVTIELPLQYFGSIEHYALMSAFGHVVIDDTARFDKRFKSAHRCVIADTRGPLLLTVPIRKSTDTDRHSPLLWSDIAISDHGQWWQDIDVSLASAYGRTPFYEFYIDRLRKFFDRQTPDAFRSVADLDIACDAAIRAILGLATVPTYKSSISESDRLREPQNASERVYAKTLLPQLQTVEYYQVRRDRLGFIPSLSILDLIFNLGPESPLLLRAMTARLTI